MNVSRQKRGTRVALAALALAWLQMALVPCVMASVPAVSVEVDASAQIDGQPQVQDEARESAQPQMAHDCPYCPEGATGCDDQSTTTDGSVRDCLFPHGTQSENPAGQSAWSVLAHAVPVDSWHASERLRDSPALISTYSAPPVPRPPRLRYCIQRR